MRNSFTEERKKNSHLPQFFLYQRWIDCVDCVGLFTPILSISMEIEGKSQRLCCLATNFLRWIEKLKVIFNIALKFGCRKAFEQKAVNGKLNFAHGWWWHFNPPISIIWGTQIHTPKKKTIVKIKCFAHFVGKLDFSIFTNCKYASCHSTDIYLCSVEQTRTIPKYC